jgi:hypothetical protein
MGDVRACECKVLQSTGVASVLGRVGKKSTIIGRQFTLDINGGGTRVAVGHASTLAQRKHHAGGGPCYRDAEEERQSAEISHGELGVELLCEALKKLGSGAGDDDVVHVQEDEGKIRAILVDEQRDI